MQMRLARRADIAALTSLWQECFGDEEDYIAAFYADRFDSIRVALAEDEAGRVIGMIHMLPCTSLDGAAENRHAHATNAASGNAPKTKNFGTNAFGTNAFGTNAYYLYAVGMARAWRGRGVMRTLMTNLVDECRGRSVALTLSPVNPRLNAYYESYGFSYAAGVWQDFFERSSLASPSDVRWRACDAERYFACRTACLGGSAHVAFPLDAVRYALAENAYGGGFAMTSSSGDAVLGQRTGDHLVLRELCVATEDASSARASVAALLSELSAEHCELRSTLALSSNARPLYTVMAQGLAASKSLTYMNLLLD